jgi:radical SAM protein with 4Fe4S-binding SPASM domain
MDRVPLPVIPPLPREIQIEVTGACNLRCRMCLVSYRPALHRVAGSMTLEAFKRIVDALPDLETITLQGLGEPLLAPDLLGMIEHASARGVRAGFNTNATLLHREAAERLVAARLAWLCVSLDGARAETYEAIRRGARFSRVLANVRGLVAVMRDARATLPDLSIVFVAMRRNIAELPEVVRLCDELGVRALRVQNLSHSFDDTDPAGEYREIRDSTAREARWQRAASHPDEAAARSAFAEARSLSEELGVELRLPSIEADRAAPRAEGAPGCDWPWRSAYVRHDGKVQPCCMLMGEGRAILGDANDAGFAEVWRGEPYRAFRQALLTTEAPAVCRGCSMYRGVF